MGLRVFNCRWLIFYDIWLSTSLALFTCTAKQFGEYLNATNHTMTIPTLYHGYSLSTLPNSPPYKNPRKINQCFFPLKGNHWQVTWSEKFKTRAFSSLWPLWAAAKHLNTTAPLHAVNMGTSKVVTSKEQNSNNTLKRWIFQYQVTLIIPGDPFKYIGCFKDIFLTRVDQNI